MTAVSWFTLILTAVLAVLDWAAVAADSRSVERVARPGVIAALVATALALHPTSDSQRMLFLVALALCLARDILAVGPPGWFPAAIVASAAAQVVYAVGFQRLGWSWLWAAAGIVVVVVAALAYGVRLIAAVREVAPRETLPVMAYLGALSLMVVAAAATGRPTAVAGAFLFYVSDTVAGWNRYRGATPYGRPVMAASYHLAQILLVLSLL